MFVLDDLLVRPLLSIVDVLQTMALSEMYDVGAIQDELKENQLLYEIGERSREEYEERREELEAELELAERVHEELANGKVEVKR